MNTIKEEKQEEIREQIEFLISDISDLLNANYKYQSIYDEIKNTIDLRINGFTNEDMHQLATSIEGQISYFMINWYEENKNDFID